MITSATTVNTVYGQSAVNSTINNKADAASFAAAFANASSAPAKTSSTASADKVTISAQAQQVSLQDDIEAEAQKLAKIAMDDPKWKQGLTRLFFGNIDNITPSNKALGDRLKNEVESMKGTPAMNTPRYAQAQMMQQTLAAFPDKQDFTEESLKHQTDIYKRYHEITGLTMSEQQGAPYLAWESTSTGYFSK